MPPHHSKHQIHEQLGPILLTWSSSIRHGQVRAVKCGMKVLIHFKSSTVVPLKFGNGKLIPPHPTPWTLYNGCNHLSMLGLKWIHAGKSVPEWFILSILLVLHVTHLVLCHDGLNQYFRIMLGCWYHTPPTVTIPFRYVDHLVITAS